MLIRIFETILIMLNILKSVNNSYCKKYYFGQESNSDLLHSVRFSQRVANGGKVLSPDDPRQAPPRPQGKHDAVARWEEGDNRGNS